MWEEKKEQILKMEKKNEPKNYEYQGEQKKERKKDLD